MALSGELCLMYTKDQICDGCVNALICNCDQKHVYGCKISSDKINRQDGSCEDKKIENGRHN
jgi:hypothetical protein